MSRPERIPTPPGPYAPGQICIIIVDPRGTRIGTEVTIHSRETCINGDPAVGAWAPHPYGVASSIVSQRIQITMIELADAKNIRCWWPIAWMVPKGTDPDAVTDEDGIPILTDRANAPPTHQRKEPA